MRNSRQDVKKIEVRKVNEFRAEFFAFMEVFSCYLWSPGGFAGAWVNKPLVTADF
ncbi:hypothetical protein [Vulcanisaeta sp. JCM 16159]|uniref:hypothetical protein n=1 Tax=Vulcanisaeta sp. JCM 16159 TaxID=1295371 RepID=UPI000A842982|nr:hypothetical protein [Vulcanisaeta sp. JCM 16159]